MSQRVPISWLRIRGRGPCAAPASAAAGPHAGIPPQGACHGSSAATCLLLFVCVDARQGSISVTLFLSLTACVGCFISLFSCRIQCQWQCAGLVMLVQIDWPGPSDAQHVVNSVMLWARWLYVYCIPQAGTCSLTFAEDRRSEPPAWTEQQLGRGQCKDDALRKAVLPCSLMQLFSACHPAKKGSVYVERQQGPLQAAAIALLFSSSCVVVSVLHTDVRQSLAWGLRTVARLHAAAGSQLSHQHTPTGVTRQWGICRHRCIV